MRRKEIVLTATVGLVALIVASVLIATSLGSQEPSPVKLQIGQTSGIEVVHIGAGTLASEVAGRLQTSGSQVEQAPDIPTARKLNGRVVVVFDGAWFEQRVDNAQLHSFLNSALASRAKLVVIGANTSKLAEALDKAGIRKLIVAETGVVRNPAYFNPPQAGFKMVMTEDGRPHPVWLFSNTNDPDALAEALVTWLIRSCCKTGQAATTGTSMR